MKETLNNYTVAQMRDLVNTNKHGMRRKLQSVNYGKFVITNIDGYVRGDNGNIRDTLFRVKFLNTGYVLHNVGAKHIRHGDIKDNMVRTTYGVGYLGEKIYQIRKEDIELHRVLVHRWANMIGRCYDEKNNRYYTYGKIGVRVSDRWHNYSNYYYDVQKIDGFNRDLILNHVLSIDKDKYQQGVPDNKKVYSKDTCCWLTTSEQGYFTDRFRLKRMFKCITPDGSIIYDNNVPKFAREHGLYSSACYSVLNGKLNQTGKYKFSYV